jgi:hypothetical protein
MTDLSSVNVIVTHLAENGAKTSCQWQTNLLQINPLHFVRQIRVKTTVSALVKMALSNVLVQKRSLGVIVN